MATAALVIYAVWATIAFGLRSLIQQHRTGDTGLRINGGPPGSLPWWTRILFVSAIATGAIAPIVDLANAIEPIALLRSAMLRGSGVLIALVGVAATFATQQAMGNSWRVGVDPEEHTELVTSGPFAVVRNPIFSAMAVTAVGLALMVPNAVALVGLALLAMALELQVRAVEEPYLRASHGPAYAGYEARVGRFMPNIGRAQTPPSHTA